jgi:hypothetical protein
MKKYNTAKQQKGFFALGFSLALLALSGSFTYAVTPGQGDRTAVQEPQIEIVASLEPGNERVDLYE